MPQESKDRIGGGSFKFNYLSSLFIKINPTSSLVGAYKRIACISINNVNDLGLHKVFFTLYLTERQGKRPS